MKIGILVQSLILCAAVLSAADIEVQVPEKAVVFDLCEITVTFKDKAAGLQNLPDTQVHDAYDGDRDGTWVRLTGTFVQGEQSIIVPGFAMRAKPNGPWEWKVRWSPRRPGKWNAAIHADGAIGKESIKALSGIKTIDAVTAKGIDGPLIMPGPQDNHRYLRQLQADGSSRAQWLFGACRAWVVKPKPEEALWAPHEYIDRTTELFPVLRKGGYNLLNQWMAPWEYLLVHRARAEFWREPDDTWKRVAIPNTRKWIPYQSFDQGRAADFDKLVKQCEGDATARTIYLLLSPLPHNCFQEREHPWGANESGWSPENDDGKQTLDKLNGFSGFKPNMDLWDFFKAAPSHPVDDPRTKLFDYQANYFRYLIARWGYSRALGLWVIIDEIDAVGKEVGWRSRRSGWWAHPEADQWLANIMRLFRGELKRSDGLAYSGDPFRHPLHAATTSYGGQGEPGGNIDWDGGLEGARPDVFGWHWYPFFYGATTWSQIWFYSIRGIQAYSRAPVGKRPRLLSEFGLSDRSDPTEEMNSFHPTLYYHGLWAAIFAGHAGTPLDWDDGKEFGEIKYRVRPGVFDKTKYPLDHTGGMLRLQIFLKGLDPEGLGSTAEPGAAVTCTQKDLDRILGLYDLKNRDRLYGWAFGPYRDLKIAIKGLKPGAYTLTWFNPWEGRTIGSGEAIVDAKAEVSIDATAMMALMRAERKKSFPRETRLYSGNDIAFKLIRQGN